LNCFSDPVGLDAETGEVLLRLLEIRDLPRRQPRVLARKQDDRRSPFTDGVRDLHTEPRATGWRSTPYFSFKSNAFFMLARLG